MQRSFTVHKVKQAGPLATLIVEAPQIDLSPKGYLTLLDHAGKSITIAMPPAGYELLEKKADAASVQKNNASAP